MKQMRHIPNFPGYFVDGKGNIYSYWTRGAKSSIDLNKKPTKLKPNKGSKGYRGVTLARINNKPISRSVHFLVCTAYNGERPSKNHTASHLDGNKSNNNPNNLIWETYSQNHKRKYEHGTHDRGLKNSRCLINKKQLNQIKKLLKENKLTYKQIGKKFGVGRLYITKISSGTRFQFD